MGLTIITVNENDESNVNEQYEIQLSYGSFNSIRKQLADVYQNKGEMEDIFFNHSDCSGAWSSDDCQRILEAFSYYRDQLDTSGSQLFKIIEFCAKNQCQAIFS